MVSRILRSGTRLAFLALIIFELLNWVQVFHVELEFTWFGLVIVAIFVWVCLEIASRSVTRKTGQPLHGAIFFLAFISICIDAFGDMYHWYSTYTWYDQLAHGFGGMTLGSIIVTLYNRLADRGVIKLGTGGRIFSATGVATMFGALYEIEEYLEDFFTGSHRLGDGVDTANDLMLDFLGALIIVTLIVIFRRSRSRSTLL